METLAEIVGGPVEAGCYLPQRVMLIRNENSKALGLPPNRANPHGRDYIAGTFLLCGFEGDSFTSLTSAQQVEFQECFAKPGEFILIGTETVCASPGKLAVTAPDNYKLSSGSKTVFVRAADTQTVSFYDDPLCTLTVLKRDAVTKKPLANAEFSVKYSDGATVGTDNGRYVTGKDGTVTVSGLKPDATVIVTETRAPKGYIKDDAAKSIVVRTGVANSLTFDNEPTTTLIVKKQDSAPAPRPNGRRRCCTAAITRR